MEKILVLYATKEGQTEKIARTLADHLAMAGVNVTLLDVTDYGAKSIVLGSFDCLVFGASIHIGKIEKSMVKFINNNADIIATMPRSFFLVLMAAATRDAGRREKSLADVRRTFSQQVKVNFPEIEMIAGALKYSQYKWPVKWLMKRIAGKEGGSTDTTRDHEYTDWAQVEAYAQKLAARDSH